jgi:hypothetical protein
MELINQTLINHSKLIKNPSLSSSTINYTLTATDLKSTGENVTFVFEIKSQNDLVYAQSLLKVYKNVLKPFIDEFDLSAVTGGSFDRFFYVGGALSRFAVGKTAHDTRSTFAMFIHYAKLYLNTTVPEQPIVDFSRNNSLWHMHEHVPWQLGHSSHFRRKYEYVGKHYRNASIQELKLDLNYFDCFFKPVMARLRRAN